MHGNDNQTVVLPSKIPVYIVYLTAYVRDGHLHFSDDVYLRDQQLEARMDSTIASAEPMRPRGEDRPSRPRSSSATR